MEVITKTEVITKQIFVACDGMEFSTEEACRGHEDDLRSNEACKIAEKLPHVEMVPPFCDGDDVTWSVYMVRSDEELAAIRNYHYCSDATADTYMDKPVYPCLIVASVDDDGYGIMYTWGEIEKEFAQFRHLVNDGIMRIVQAIVDGNQKKEEEK